MLGLMLHRYVGICNDVSLCSIRKMHVAWNKGCRETYCCKDCLLCDGALPDGCLIFLSDPCWASTAEHLLTQSVTDKRTKSKYQATVEGLSEWRYMTNLTLMAFLFLQCYTFCPKAVRKNDIYSTFPEIKGAADVCSESLLCLGLDDMPVGWITAAWWYLPPERTACQIKSSKNITSIFSARRPLLCNAEVMRFKMRHSCFIR